MDDFPVLARDSILVATAATFALLTGCVATVQAPPPSPIAYDEPPPPVYADPSADGAEMQASEPPPPLPDYDQPPCPEDGYLWAPGYWAFGPGGYYWVPGTWIAPPQAGFLWTPGYWGLVGAVYVFHPGYWSPHVGYYGGVHYGYGYTGVGYVGGHWEGNRFAYNRTVTNVNVTVVHNTYNETVVNNVSVNKASYNGGPGGVHADPTSQERQWAHEQHVNATPLQTQHAHEAASNPAMFSRANGGRPAIAATPRPTTFTAPGAVGAHGAASLTPAQQQNLTPPNNTYHPNGSQPTSAAPAPHSLQNNAFRPPNVGQPAGGQPNNGQANVVHPAAAPAMPHPQINGPYNAPHPPAAPTKPQAPQAPKTSAPKYDPKNDEHK